MTVEEAGKQINQFYNERREIERRIVEAARPLVAVLLDSGRQHSAAVLQELFFELDAKDEEVVKFTGTNIDNILTHFGRSQ